jgi:hypothetical protein
MCRGRVYIEFLKRGQIGGVLPFSSPKNCIPHSRSSYHSILGVAANMAAWCFQFRCDVSTVSESGPCCCMGIGRVRAGYRVRI